MTMSLHKSRLARISANLPLTEIFCLVPLLLAFIISAENIAFQVLLPQLASNYHFSLWQTESLATSSILPFSLGLLSAGILSRRLGYLKIMQYGLLINILGYIVLLFSYNWLSLMIGQVFVSAGAGMTTIAYITCSRFNIPRDNYGEYSGLRQTLAAFGAVTGTILVGVLFGFIYWKVLYFLVIVSLLIISLLINKCDNSFKDTSTLQMNTLNFATIRRIFTPSVAVFAACGILLFFIVMFTNFALHLLIFNVLPYTPANASLIVTVSFLGGVSGLYIGRYCDKHNSWTIMLLMMILAFAVNFLYLFITVKTSAVYVSICEFICVFIFVGVKTSFSKIYALLIAKEDVSIAEPLFKISAIISFSFAPFLAGAVIMYSNATAPIVRGFQSSEALTSLAHGLLKVSAVSAPSKLIEHAQNVYLHSFQSIIYISAGLILLAILLFQLSKKADFYQLQRQSVRS